MDIVFDHMMVRGSKVRLFKRVEDIVGFTKSESVRYSQRQEEGSRSRICKGIITLLVVLEAIEILGRTPQKISILGRWG